MNAIHLQADGRPGRAGEPGQSWTGAAACGQDGRRGGDGRRGAPGEPGGELRLRLASQDGQMQIEGASSLAGPQGHRCGIDEPVLIRLSARGGDGGKGGDAGRGEDGGRGRDGSDATRHSRGGNGGPGGAGGDAGEPADGGAAGAGGLVRCELSEDDLDLLMALEEDAAAGRPGDPGRPASGGAGGRGGSGGSSCSWTESYTEQESYTDAQGNRRTRSVTRQRHHSNPGGSDGPSGRDGRSSSRGARPGDPAPAGRIELVVRFADGQVRSYPSRYEVVVEESVFVPEAERLFPGDRFEPGQVLLAERLVLVNRGGCPTPTRQDIAIRAEGEGVEGLGEAVLPRGLQPGERTVIEDRRLRFRLLDRRLAGEEPHDALVPVRLVARVGRIRRDFAGIHDHPVQGSSPIALERLDLYNALGVGERSRFAWSVTNRSLLPFGPGGRSVATSCDDPAGDAESAALVLDGAGGTLARPAEEVLGALAPGASAELAHRIGWLPGAAPFTGRDLAVELRVAGRDGGAPQAVQRRQVRLKVSQVYLKSAESTVLIIANHGSGAGEVAAWQAMVRRLGLEADVLDLSREGAVDLDERFSAEQPLREEWAGGTVIALNNLFDSPNGRQSCADYLYDRQVAGSLRDDGISWFAPGDGRPLFGEAALKALRRRSRRVEERSVEVSGLAALDLPAEADLRLTLCGVRWFGGLPSPGRLARHGLVLLRSLAIARPEARPLLLWRHDPERLSGGWWRSRWRLGTLRLVSLPDGAAASMVQLPASQAELHDPAWIGSRAARSGLILALPWEEKLRLFTSLVLGGMNFDLEPERRELALAYADAILADLGLEQEATRRAAFAWAAWSPWRMLVDGGRQWCPRLRQLCTTGFAAALPAGSERGRILAALIGRLRSLVDAHSPWWELLLPGFRNREVSRQAWRLLDGLERTAFGQEKPLFSLPGEPWSDRVGNLAQARRLAREARHALTGAIRRAGAGPDATARLLAAACPELPLSACRLRRLLLADAERLVEEGEAERLGADQDAEDAATAARSAGHRAARTRLTGA